MKFMQKQALVLLASTAFLLSTPMLASAHDEIVGTTPAADSTVSAGAVTVSVTFNEDIMKNPDLAGEVIEVVDANNNALTLNAGCLSVEGATLSTQITAPHNGQYTVNWRSVSNDGHANEGSFKFTVANEDSNNHNVLSAEANASCQPIASGIDRAASDDSATPEVLVAPAPTSSAAPTPDPFITNLPYLGFGVLLIVLGAIAGPLLQRSRERRAARKAAIRSMPDED